MHQVLQNLVNGLAADHDLVEPMQRWNPVATILGTLRNRGYVMHDTGLNYSITPQGREALRRDKERTN